MIMIIPKYYRMGHDYKSRKQSTSARAVHRKFCRHLRLKKDSFIHIDHIFLGTIPSQTCEFHDLPSLVFIAVIYYNIVLLEHYVLQTPLSKHDLCSLSTSRVGHVGSFDSLKVTGCPKREFSLHSLIFLVLFCLTINAATKGRCLLIAKLIFTRLSLCGY